MLTRGTVRSRWRRRVGCYEIVGLVVGSQRLHLHEPLRFACVRYRFY